MINQDSKDEIKDTNVKKIVLEKINIEKANDSKDKLLSPVSSEMLSARKKGSVSKGGPVGKKF